MISSRIRRNSQFIKILSEANPRTAKTLIQAAPKDLIDSICECGLNVLYGTIPLTPQQRRHLNRYKIPLRNLCSKRSRISQKQKKLILQKGGFLGALLKPVLGVLATALLS